jgi:hypothetical protein
LIDDIVRQHAVPVRTAKAQQSTGAMAGVSDPPVKREEDRSYDDRSKDYGADGLGRCHNKLNGSCDL